MPVKITKVDGYQVKTPGGVKAKSTTKKNAESQKRLLNAIDKQTHNEHLAERMTS